MNIRFLETFLTVVEEKSFSAAAKRLHLTQPAVTKHIQSLERHFETSLFERKGWRSEPTDAGKALIGYAEQIISAFGHAEQDLKKMGDVIRGILRVGASTIPGEYVLPMVVGEFTMEFPDVHLQVEIGDSGRIRDMVAGKELDAGFVGAKAGDENSLEYVPFAVDRLVLVVPPGHPWAAKSSLHPKELTDYPLVWREKMSGTRTVVERVLSDLGIYPTELIVKLEFGSTEAVLNAAASGNGAAIISRYAAERYLRLGRLVEVPIEGHEFQRPLYMVYRRENQINRVMEVFVQFVRDKAAL